MNTPEYTPLAAALRTIRTPSWRLWLVRLFGRPVLYRQGGGEPVMLRQYGGKLYML